MNGSAPPLAAKHERGTTATDIWVFRGYEGIALLARAAVGREQAKVEPLPAVIGAASMTRVEGSTG